ncbi:MAG: merA [Pedosphaera sp.]|nr:merA [Pedosphaera sp.]
MLKTEQFELIVFGGGKGGKTLAVDLGRAGHRVALVERGMIGGSCINVACIPTKSFVKCAGVLHGAKTAATYGVRTGEVAADWPAIQKRVQGVVADMVAMNLKNFLSAPGHLDLVLGTGRFVGPRTIEVRGNDGLVRALTSEKIVIDTGSRPSLPTVPGLAEAGFETSESLQRVEKLPSHLIIHGAGYVAMEFAQMFRRFGSQVTVIARGPQLISREDADIAEALATILREEGIDLRFNTVVERAAKTANGITLSLKTGDATSKIEGSHVLVALGRSPNTEELNLPVAQVETDRHGFIKVNERLETTAPGIWAIGDVNGGPQFTHSSLDDYRILKANIYNNGRRTTTERYVPSTVFVEPELAHVGLREKEARAQSLKYRVVKAPFSVIPRAKASGESAGLMKALIDVETQRVLGCTILGAQAGEIIGIVQMAMIGGLPYTAIRDGIWSHPTFSEGFNALFAA